MNLSSLTTLRVGGPAHELIEATDDAALVSAALTVWASGEDWLALGGGSNVVIGDDGFDGAVIRVLSRGIAVLAASDDRVVLRVQAGEPWDDLVAHTVEQGWAGIEALSGIPGSCGAAPIQNIGAYGQEIGDALVAIDFLDYLSGDRVRLEAHELGLGYRTSVLKHERRGIVLAIELALTPGSSRIVFPQLAGALGVEIGERMPVAQVRDAVLALRASKGMVLAEHDPDSVSAGSFFTNPIVSERFARGLPSDAPRFPIAPQPVAVAVPLGMPPAPPPAPASTEVKLSAAWLIERAGVTRGFRLPGSRAAVSSKHTLALTNTGGATAEEVAQLARYVQTRVLAEFGVRLQPEPVFVGLTL